MGLITLRAWDAFSYKLGHQTMIELSLILYDYDGVVSDIASVSFIYAVRVSTTPVYHFISQKWQHSLSHVPQ